MPTPSRFNEFASLASLATATVYELARGDAFVAARKVEHCHDRALFGR